MTEKSHQEKPGSAFDQLLEELDTLQKSFDQEDEEEETQDPEGDRKIAQSAEPSEGESTVTDHEDKTVEGEADDDETMGKSFTVTLEDGTKLKALEGTALVKSLMNEMSSQKSTLEKALGLAVDNMKAFSEKLTTQSKTLKSQGKLIKALQSDLEKFGNQGKGRKTVISVHEKRSPDEFRKSHDQKDGLSRQEFMAKALTAQREGKVTGLELSKAESYLNRGLEVPEDIVRKVIA